MKRSLTMICLLVLLAAATGCSRKMTINVDGGPAPQNAIKATVPYPPMKLSYALVRFYGVSEGDETLETWEYISMIGYNGAHEVKKKNLRRLVLKLSIYNPETEDYSLVVSCLRENLKTGKQWMDQSVLYEGNLSRKDLDIEFPPDIGTSTRVKFRLYDDEGELAHESFEAFFQISP